LTHPAAGTLQVSSCCFELRDLPPM
jgi:hypothetical protein